MYALRIILIGFFSLLAMDLLVILAANVIAKGVTYAERHSEWVTKHNEIWVTVFVGVFWLCVAALCCYITGEVVLGAIQK